MSRAQENTQTSNQWGIGMFFAWVAGMSTVVGIGWFILCVNIITPPDFGYGIDYMNGGEIIPLKKEGVVVTSPFVRVYTIDTRARQECLRVGDISNNDGLNSRISNCLLLQFDPNGLKELIARHGTGISGNISKILALHAFDTSGTPPPPFVHIVPQKPRSEQ